MMWAVTGFFFLVVGAVVWILEHRMNDEFRGPPKQQFVTTLWFSFSTLFFAHRENTVSTLGRMVLIIWLFVVLIINSSYTASLTSMLSVQQISSPIKGIESLITTTEPIGYQVGSFADPSNQAGSSRSLHTFLSFVDDKTEKMKGKSKRKASIADQNEDDPCGSIREHKMTLENHMNAANNQTN